MEAVSHGYSRIVESDDVAALFKGTEFTMTSETLELLFMLAYTKNNTDLIHESSFCLKSESITPFSKRGVMSKYIGRPDTRL